MSFIAVIPARYGSTRLPGKPLRDIGGKPMIQWVYEQACKSQASRVVVATDDQRIADAVADFQGDVCMTAADHQSGTDRLAEVAQQLQLSADDIVVNVQGDEPLIPPEVINQVAANLAASSAASVATLSEPIAEVGDFLNPNIVKVTSDSEGLALTFSRAPIPWPRDAFAKSQQQLPDSDLFQRHIGIYAYRARLLSEFVTWPVAALEAIESLEQMRVLENGRRIHVAQAVADVPGGVDTEADLERVCALVASGAQ